MRTRLIPLVLATTAALAGCATAPRVQDVAPAAPPPLRVWIGFPIGSSQVYPIFTNREAHVAMFEIIPGRGATMVYPFSRGHEMVADAHYANLTLQPGRMFYYTDPFGHASYQPRYYYAVASVAPLNLERLQTSLGATRRVLGRMYASYRPYDVIDRLTEIVVPMQTDENWATDLFVDWPMPRMPRFTLYRSVRCANGRIIQVASNYPYYGCPGDARLTVVAADVPREPPKEVAKDAPRGPRDGPNREGVELSSPGGEKRRAVPGDRPPRVGGVMRSPADGIRYSDDRSARRARDGGSSTGRASRSPASAPASSTAGSAERGRSVERAQPVSKPAAEPRGESGKEKKP
ncbi:MAG TPA: hypothetical protein VJ802_14270 [Gemmatimonadaceae bacterium]|nr:hypothetical protein [Gemmatimonadaceae bacterium]